MSGKVSRGSGVSNCKAVAFLLTIRSDVFCLQSLGAPFRLPETTTVSECLEKTLPMIQLVKVSNNQLTP